MLVFNAQPTGTLISRRDRQRQTDRQRQRKTEAETERERQRETETEGDRDRERVFNVVNECVSCTLSHQLAKLTDARG